MSDIALKDVPIGTIFFITNCGSRLGTYIRCRKSNFGTYLKDYNTNTVEKYENEFLHYDAHGRISKAFPLMPGEKIEIVQSLHAL